MIFVTVGSSATPFDRLLRAVDALRVEERLVVQHGPSTIRPKGAECSEALSHTEFLDLVRSARVVVTHAGVGSIMTALGEQTRPIVVPRLAALGEAVDDHQVSFARRAAELGFVVLVEDVERLAAEIASPLEIAGPAELRRSPIEVELRSYIEELVGPGLAESNGREYT